MQDRQIFPFFHPRNHRARRNFATVVQFVGLLLLVDALALRYVSSAPREGILSIAKLGSALLLSGLVLGLGNPWHNEIDRYLDTFFDRMGILPPPPQRRY